MELRLLKKVSEEYGFKKVSDEDTNEIKALSDNIKESFWTSALLECKNISQFKECFDFYKQSGELILENDQKFRIALLRICYLTIRNNPNFTTLLDAYKMVLQVKLKHDFLEKSFANCFKIIANEEENMREFYNHIKELREIEGSDQYLNLKEVFCNKCYEINNDEITIENLEATFGIYCYLKTNPIEKSINEFKNEKIEEILNNLIEMNLDKFEQRILWALNFYNKNVLKEKTKETINKKYNKIINDLYPCQVINKNAFTRERQSIYENTKAKDEYELYIFNGISKNESSSEVIKVVIKKYCKIKNDTRISETIREGHFLEKFSKNDLFLKFYGSIRGDNKIKLVMEKCDGTLADYIKKVKEMKYSRFLEISEKIARALYELKNSQVIHRDIKPDNIFMIGDDVRLSDFSVSNYEKDINGSSGTKGYRAPELNKKNEKTNWYKCDIYSFGMTLIQIRYLLNNSNENMMYSSTIDKIKQLSMLESIKENDLKALLRRMTDENPERRPDIEAVIGYLQAMTIKFNKKNQS